MNMTWKELADEMFNRGMSFVEWNLAHYMRIEAEETGTMPKWDDPASALAMTELEPHVALDWFGCPVR